MSSPLPQPTLTPWERATDVAEACTVGLVPARYSGRLTLAVALGFGVCLWPLFGFWGGVLALIFARLVALDVVSYTLPNIYTVPMMLVGLVAALGAGHLVATLVLWLALLLLASMGRLYPGARLGVGEGDLKLLAAMAGFLALPQVLVAIVAGCVLWMPVAWAFPKKALPLGVPLVLGWVVVLCWPGLPVALFGPITH